MTPLLSGNYEGSDRINTLQIVWTGPYGWPGYSAELPLLPQHPGVYLQTVQYRDGFLIYAAGLTRRPFAARFAEHTRRYLAGDYHVLDIAAMQRGVRKQIWEGWSWSTRKRAVFEKRKNDIVSAVRHQLAGYRLFVADLGLTGRTLERVEAAIMNTLYCCPPPLCDIPDKGMRLTPRRDAEEPILTINHFPAHLCGLPKELQI